MMPHPVAALVCAILGVLLLWLGLGARRREVGIEGRVVMPLAGVMFLVAALVYGLLSVVDVVT